ncbi:uncharacterized protein L201_002073 [Kwoniella dendrophila CBS 6074]|uniref:C2H2-type domain-containing protein n=1 Tax=Kwoniella dendrophila CBS 6074 TaxID=1295534 RepID=A0AAX4JP72_9TREE
MSSLPNELITRTKSPTHGTMQINRVCSSTGSVAAEPLDTSLDLLHADLYPLPPPTNCPPRPLNSLEAARVEKLSQLQFFLTTAPTHWGNPFIDSSPSLKKFQLPNGESVSCVLWKGLFHITGTDIVRALAYRFEAFGRPVHLSKKWEEGVFSDLRNLKPGVDAALEEPKSPLLEFLFRNGCIRTQKKQKVFYWFSVPHDRLFLDALERDLKREKAGQEVTSVVTGEPAMSFRYDPKRTLYEQFAGKNPGMITFASPAPEISHHGTEIINPTSYATAIHNHPYQMRSNQQYDPSNGQSQYDFDTQLMLEALADNPLTFKRTMLPGSSNYKRRCTASRQANEPDKSVNQTDQLPVSRAWTSSPQLVTGVGSKPTAPKSRASSTAPPRVYICVYEECRRGFKRLEHLKRHVRTHTNERPFACSSCTRTFTRYDNLVQHLKTHQKLSEPPIDPVDSRNIIRRRTKDAMPSCVPISAQEHFDIGTDKIDYASNKSSDLHGYSRSFTAPPDWIEQQLCSSIGYLNSTSTSLTPGTDTNNFGSNLFPASHDYFDISDKRADMSCRRIGTELNPVLTYMRDAKVVPHAYENGQAFATLTD